MNVPIEWWAGGGNARARRTGIDSALGLLGLRRAFVVDGVRYVERTAEPLRRALGARGRGFKEYDVTFADGDVMRIRATRERFYPDLISQRIPPLGRLIEVLVRPGMRVLQIGAGTGQTAAWIALCAGASGSVVALERDGESVRFARRRFQGANIAFEVAGVEALTGELDGAFDGVLAASGVESPLELWRVVVPGGWLLAGDALAGALRDALPSVGPLGEAVGDAALPLRLVLFRKPGEVSPQTPPPQDEDGPEAP
ncbi:MAG: class I SAM-dependent methyltransferase [Phycisphaeraceae bacterium]|nr:class I SAM-dependent methyltransferase [Phycisphaeraceae bacterium]